MQTPAIGNGAEKDDPAPAPEKQRRPLAIVQRSIGWISLGVLLWVAANYAGIGTAEKLAMQTNRVISYVMSLR